MSLIDGLLGQALGNLGDGQQGKLLQAAAGMIRQQGGLDALKQKFDGQNLGNIVASWIGKGQNQPITGDQVSQVFGQNQIQELARQVGISPGDAAGGLARVLPGLVDQLTPDGTSVGGQMLEQGLAKLLGGLR